MWNRTITKSVQDYRNNIFNHTKCYSGLIILVCIQNQYSWGKDELYIIRIKRKCLQNIKAYFAGPSAPWHMVISVTSAINIHTFWWKHTCNWMINWYIFLLQQQTPITCNSHLHNELSHNTTFSWIYQYFAGDCIDWTIWISSFLQYFLSWDRFYCIYSTFP